MMERKKKSYKLKEWGNHVQSTVLVTKQWNSRKKYNSHCTSPQPLGEVDESLLSQILVSVITVYFICTHSNHTYFFKQVLLLEVKIKYIVQKNKKINKIEKTLDYHFWHECIQSFGEMLISNDRCSWLTEWD